MQRERTARAPAAGRDRLRFYTIGSTTANTMRSKQLKFPFVVAFLASVTACGSTEGATEISAPGFEDSALDVYEIEVLPDFSALPSVSDRPDERFVMVNMLVFKDMATGEGFEGLTGSTRTALPTC